MPEILHRAPWDRPGLRATPEHLFLDRRRLLRGMGFAGLAGLLAPALACAQEAPGADADAIRRTLPKPAPPHPAKRNDAWKVEREATPELIAASYNNFYELGTDKSDPWKQGHRLKTTPWTVEVTGLCAAPRTFGIEDLEKAFGLEERLYRFRCVEAWSMTVPWAGFPLAKLLAAVEPKAEAQYVRFLSTHQPDLPGVRSQPHYTWPYYEGLTLAEATAEPTLVALGAYGHALPNQMGAPARIIVPWKYGYKGAKSVVRIELVKDRPRTFWNDLQPDEYGFESNVDPKVRHPRWSQATERLLDDGRRIPTQHLNGYADHVGRLYA